MIKVICVGVDPAGVYLALLLKRLATRPTVPLPQADLIILADGAQSPLRSIHAAEFGTVIEPSTTCSFLFDVDLASEKLEFWFQATSQGVFHTSLTHCGAASVLRLVASAQTIDAAGLGAKDAKSTAGFCEGIFSEELKGHKLHPRGEGWRAFNHLRNARWSSGHVVLVGAAQLCRRQYDHSRRPRRPLRHGAARCSIPISPATPPISRATRTCAGLINTVARMCLS